MVLSCSTRFAASEAGYASTGYFYRPTHETMNRHLSLLLCGVMLVFAATSCKKNNDQGPATTPPVDSPKVVTPKVDTPSTMTKNSFASTSNGTIGYWLYTPKNPTENMPMIVYLHGGSGRGSDLNLVISGSLPLFLTDSTVKDVPAYIIMPQCPTGKSWEQIAGSVKELADKVIADKKINSKKVALTGHSMGGSGTWSLGATYSTFFSCMVPCSGSVNANNAANYKSIPVYAFVGSDDTVVPPTSSQNIVPMINSAGGNAQIKVYPDATHFDVPGLVYKDQAVKIFDWMISQSK